jgi:hypothetical protein
MRRNVTVINVKEADRKYDYFVFESVIISLCMTYLATLSIAQLIQYKLIG